MATFINIVLALPATFAASIVLLMLYALVREGSQVIVLATERLLEALPDVRWKACCFHAVLGFAVSCLVSPHLHAALALAAGWTSTLIVAFVMHQLENIEVKTPARSRVRS